MDQILKESVVVARTAQGTELRGTPLRLARRQAVFELPGRQVVLQTSEVLEEFQIVLRERTVYSGRAVVKGLVDTGLVLVCEAVLDDSWVDVNSYSVSRGAAWLQGEFQAFFSQWQRVYRVLPEYKIVVADIQTFLTELRLWLGQIEVGIRAESPAERRKIEDEIARGLRERIVSALASMFSRFEDVSRKIDEELVPAHRAFGQRQLHPLLLCAPFIHRTYAKPLGFAGDYEMMNMILRNAFEGDSLYARLVNAYMLDQAPAHAVRNRVGYLTARIAEETARVTRSGRPARVFNVACGPAREVEDFLAASALAGRAEFRLLDFSEETLQYAASRLGEARSRHGQGTSIELVKNSVHTLLKTQGRSAPGERRFDFIYSSGLYDYLGDRVCKALNSHLYEQLAPGGLLLIGNFNETNPIQSQMEHFLEWFLIYRSTRQMASLVPDQVAPEGAVVRAEPTGTNIFLEIRKPE